MASAIQCGVGGRSLPGAGFVIVLFYLANWTCGELYIPNSDIKEGLSSPISLNFMNQHGVVAGNGPTRLTRVNCLKCTNVNKT